MRIREIYYNDILEIKNQHVLFRVGCEAGTYIRKLCYDIGEVLCSGANMLELRRTKVGNFREDSTLFTLQNLKDAWEIYQEELDESYLRKIILPMEKMVSHLPKVYVRDTAVDAICHGADLAASGICFIDARINAGDLVALMTLKKELIGFGQSLFNAIKIYKAKNGIMIKLKKVFMDRGIYPHWSDKK